jgi:uncharacterized protein (TIGR00645 family)
MRLNGSCSRPDFFSPPSIWRSPSASSRFWRRPGYTNFVAPVAMRKDDGRPHWIAEIDFSELKLKLMASIVAISAIKLLEAFMNIEHQTDRELYWLVGIHLTFVVSTIVLALAERFGPHTHPSDVDSEGA